MKYKFTEIFNVEDLRKLCKSFTQLNGTVIAIFDLEENIHVTTGFKDLCKEFHKNSYECIKRCVKNKTILYSQIEDAEKIKICECKNGLLNITMPIYVGNEHIANFFTCQFLSEEPNIECFKKQAIEFDLDEKAYLEVLSEIPIFTKKELEKNVHFLINLTEIIGNLGLKEIKLKEKNQSFFKLNKDYERKNKELKISKEKAEKINKRLELSLKISKASVFEDNLVTGEAICTPELLFHLGYNENELPKKLDDFLKLIHKDDLPIVYENLQKHIDGKAENYYAEFRVLNKKGNWHWVDGMGNIIERNEKGEAIKLIGISRDISQKKKNEFQLDNENKRFVATMDAIDAVVYAADMKTYEILFLNKLGRDLFGNEVGGKCYEILQKGQKQDCSFCSNNKLLDETGNPKEPYIWEFQNTKTKNWYQIIDKAIQWIDGRIVRLEIAIDITKRKEIEQCLLESKKKAEKSDENFRDIIENSTIAIYKLNLKSGTYDYLSPSVKEMYGYSPKEFIEGGLATSISRFHPEDVVKIKNHLDKLLENKVEDFSSTVEYRFMHPKLGYRWMRDTRAVIRDENGIAISLVGFALDITEQKSFEQKLIIVKQKTEEREILIHQQYNELQSTEEELRSAHEELMATTDALRDTNIELIFAKQKTEENEKRFRSIVENTKAGYFFINNEGILEKVNKAWLDLYKYQKEEEVIGLHFSLVQQIDDLESAEKFVAEIRDKNPDYMIGDFSRKCKDGSIGYHSFSSRPVYSDNKIIGIEGFILDVTKQKLFENELIKSKKQIEESEKQFQQLFENMTQGFALHKMIYDENNKPIDYSFILINKSFSKLTGLNKEIIGKTVLEILPKTEPVWIENYGKVAQKGTVLNFENYSQEFDKFYDVVVYSPKKDFFAVIFTDVTQNKKYQNELIKAKEKAEESDRLKTEFINNMSHEIRTPMNGILGFSDFLKKENLSDRKRNYYISIIQNSGYQLMRVIDDILEISKLGTKQVKVSEQEICLNDLLLELFSIFDIKAKENKTPLYLKNGLSNKNSIILTDDIKLNKILSNLIENALKFTREGYIEFGYKLKNNLLEIYVKDTGIGIAKNKQKIIFERFSQEEKELSGNFGGLGLGLSIAKENTELLGGKISLKSEKGKGAIFFVSIPYKPVYENEISLDKYTILIVEDEEINFLYINTLLEEEINLKFNILHAKNGQEAVDICKQNNEIDLVFMDLKMPVMNGFKATKLIKEFRKDLPIIAQTAYTSCEDKEKAFDAGCNSFITKPIEQNKIEEIVKEFLK